MIDTKAIVGDESGSVFIRFDRPTEVIVLDPQPAYAMGEELARAAHRARFGTEPPSDSSYLAEQVRLRVSEQMRERKIARVAIMVQNAMAGQKSPRYWAMQIVDAILSDIA